MMIPFPPALSFDSKGFSFINDCCACCQEALKQSEWLKGKQICLGKQLITQIYTIPMAL